MNKAKVIKSLMYKFIERFSVKGIGLVISISSHVCLRRRCSGSSRC